MQARHGATFRLIIWGSLLALILLITLAIWAFSTVHFAVETSSQTPRIEVARAFGRTVERRLQKPADQVLEEQWMQLERLVAAPLPMP